MRERESERAREREGERERERERERNVESFAWHSHTTMGLHSLQQKKLQGEERARQHFGAQTHYKDLSEELGL